MHDKNRPPIAEQLFIPAFFDRIMRSSHSFSHAGKMRGAEE
jgi:hypothetical protein